LKINQIYNFFSALLLITLYCSCATHKVQYEESQPAQNENLKTSHTFYILGGFGNQQEPIPQDLLKRLRSELAHAEENSTLLFTGDNTSKETNAWSRDKMLLDMQLELVENFKGRVFFLPGNNEWKQKHIDSVQRMEEYLDEFETTYDYVLPNNGCPLEYIVINDSLDLLLVDSKWFISNWSRVEGINKKCTDIVTRRRFAEELEGYINDAQGKNLVIAMHHPIFSNGTYAGHESLKAHLLPAPILGSVVQGVKDLGAFSPDNPWSRRYNHLRILVGSLAKDSDRITLVSGHEESLQYLSGGNIHQLISGSLGNAKVTNRTTGTINAVGGSLPYKGHFTYGEQGFIKLQYFENGASQAEFITGVKESIKVGILDKLKQTEMDAPFERVDAKTVKNTVRNPEKKLKRSSFYRWLWGHRYRRYFDREVSAPVAYLDTLYGGLKITKKGGGHQSYSIRLEDANQSEFAMRSLRKNPLKFLKYSVRGVAFSEDDYMGTLTEELVSDFFTSAHPYMQMVINPMAKAVDVNHADTRLFHVPKQKALGSFNEQFGNELYFIEQRPSDEQLNYKGYRRTIDEKGKITEFESTTDMLEKIKGDESYSVDQQSFVRARLFDMLLGDWDRHEDQWRWAEYEKPNGDKEFMPVPRDRDNAFPRFDGAAVEVIQWFIPITRQWQSYGPTIQNLKWLNYAGSKLDRAILSKYDTEGWVREAKYIKENLSEATIDRAFLRLPKEVQDSTARYIRESLKKRLNDLPKYAEEYGAFLEKQVVLYASEKDDEVKVVRLPKGKTEVIMRRLLSDRKNEKFYQRIFSAEKTDEVWIYGLGDNDNFEVEGEGEAKIVIRLIGGYGKDDFNINNTKRLKVYDWTYEEMELEGKKPAMQLTDMYKTNTFHWRYFKHDRNILVPNFDFRTDDGFSIGVKNTYIHNGFNGNPFRQKHTLQGKYFFGFQAMEFDYKGVFANIIPKWNFELDGYYSSQRYARNFFGFGNNSVNEEDSRDIDFYRARTEQIKLSAGVAYHTLRFKALYESFDVAEIDSRLFTLANFDTPIFERQHYVGGETSLYYYNDN